MYIIMLGAPGSGKGTLAKELSKEYNLVHISTGDIFRENIKKQTELGKEADKYISNGLLVPDEITIGLVKSRLSEDDVKSGAILDGFPRTAKQAEELDMFIRKNNPINTVAVLLDIPDEDLIKRVVKRVTCSNKECGAIYNTEFRPSKVPGICDICGGTLKRRDDDNEEIDIILRISGIRKSTSEPHIYIRRIHHHILVFRHIPSGHRHCPVDLDIPDHIGGIMDRIFRKPYPPNRFES